MNEEELISQEIEEDSFSPGPADVRLRRSGVHVWAIVGQYLNAADRDKQAVARDYELSLEEIEAALAYFRRHRDVIEARLAANRIAVGR